jgi:P27 family predicted phage terminase small subunit
MKIGERRGKMARPTKSASTYKGKIGKNELEQRRTREKSLRGSSLLVPPSYLNDRQTELFEFIVQELENAAILCGLDTYILETCVIAIDRLQYIEQEINRDMKRLYDRDLLSAKDKYTKDLYRCCNELSLSPQSRAKLANINVQSEKEQKDPVLMLLAGTKA